MKHTCVKRKEHKHHYSWLLSTNQRRCDFTIQSHCYDEGVVLEEHTENWLAWKTYLLKDFPENSLPYTFQDKYMLEVICLKEQD